MFGRIGVGRLVVLVGPRGLSVIKGQNAIDVIAIMGATLHRVQQV